MTGWGDPFYLKFWVKKLTALERTISPIFALFLPVAPQPWHEKVNTIKSITRFQWAQDEHRKLSLGFQGVRDSKTQSVQNLNNKLR